MSHRFPVIPLVTAFAIGFGGPLAAAVAPQGGEIPIDPFAQCSDDLDVGVIGTPRGAFLATWVDDAEGYAIEGRRVTPAGIAVGEPSVLLPLHGGLMVSSFEGVNALGYQLAINVDDFGEDPAEPAAAYRVEVAANAQPEGTASRQETRRFVALYPQADGESLRLRTEAPIFSTGTCGSWAGVVAERVDEDGTAISATSRITRQASAWNGQHLDAAPTGDGRLAVAYSTCERFRGVVARRLTAAGAPIGKALQFPLAGEGVGNFALGSFAVAAQGSNLAFAAMVYRQGQPGELHLGAAQGNRVLPVRRLAADQLVTGVADLTAAPNGHYLLLYHVINDNAVGLWAQELDTQGKALGAPLALTAAGETSVAAAAASVGGNRWAVVARNQRGNPGSGGPIPNEPDCEQRIVARVVRGG